MSKLSSAPAQITVVAYDPRGELLVAGLVDGQCVFYDATSMNYVTSVTVKNRYSGLNARPARITGCQFDSTSQKLLVTTNDSNIRIISMEDFTVTMKFKGTINKDTGTIRAYFAAGDEQHIICGSQCHNVFLWRTEQDAGDESPYPRYGYTTSAAAAAAAAAEAEADPATQKKLKEDRRTAARALRRKKCVGVAGVCSVGVAYAARCVCLCSHLPCCVCVRPQTAAATAAATAVLVTGTGACRTSTSTPTSTTRETSPCRWR